MNEIFPLARSNKIIDIPESKILFRKIRLEQMIINGKRHSQSKSPLSSSSVSTEDMTAKKSTSLNESKKNTKEKWSELHETFVEWSLLTKFDCYSKIFEYKRLVSRLFWLLLFLACMGVTAWLITKNILDYMNWEIITRTEIITERPTIFPTITVCDNNPFTTKYAEDLIKNVTLNQYGVDLENMTLYQVIIGFI